MDLTQTYIIKLTNQQNIELLANMLLSEDLSFFYNGREATFYIMLDTDNMYWLLTALRELDLSEDVYLTHKGKKYNEWGEEVVV